MKKSIIDIMYQMLPVMIGVYLGFALNNFGESQKLKNQTNTFKQMLKNEVKQNLDSVMGVKPYHEDIKEKFGELLNSEDIKGDFEKLKFQGLRPGFVVASTYKTGIQTGVIQELELRLVRQINSLYTLQEKYNVFNENLMSYFISAKFPESESEIRNMLIKLNMTLNDIENFENELVKFYNSMLERFD